ncbi:MAG: DUF3748 domain-containing protein [Bacteroidota bacterium]
MRILILSIFLLVFTSCNDKFTTAKERQITFTEKNHALDNNDNFSPDNKFLCYDTRGTVFNESLDNTKSIEIVEIATGKETIIWNPPSITGNQAAPGLGATSYHPIENKLIFISGPSIEEVEKRGFYSQKNRTALVVSTDGLQNVSYPDLRDVESEITPLGAHRGGTHRHEYSKKGNRIGFTYDDYLCTDYDRTIGVLFECNYAPKGATHCFSLIVKPAKKGQSKAGEIEKATGDSWVDSVGTKRAFIGKVRAENGEDYENSLFVAELPDYIESIKLNSGTKSTYPEAMDGVKIRRLTNSKFADGIVRGSNDGKYIAYFDRDSSGVKQIFIIPVDGSDMLDDIRFKPHQVTFNNSDASALRWHPTGKYIFYIVSGNIAVSRLGKGAIENRTTFLTNDDKKREHLVVSHDGKTLAYTIKVTGKDKQEFRQIFILDFNPIQ